jgi:hypothetical protein
VQLLPRGTQQSSIRGILHEGMLEQVCRVRRQTLPEKQTSLNEPVER